MSTSAQCVCFPLQAAQQQIQADIKTASSGKDSSSNGEQREQVVPAAVVASNYAKDFMYRDT